MIESIEFVNFKAFKNSGKVKLKKINILVGPNSGGKSSFIKGLLTLKNTIDSRYKEAPIDVNKEIGDFKSIVYEHDFNNKVGFKIQFNKDKFHRKVNIEYILFKIADELKKKTKSDINHILEEIIKKQEDYCVKSIDIFLNKNEEKVIVDKFTVKYESGEKLEVFYEGSDYNILINNTIIKIPNLIYSEKFYFKINEEELQNAEVEELKLLALVYNTFEEIKKNLKKYTDSIIHISSFRNRPERVEYITRSSSSHTVGINGENMIAALINSSNDKRKKINTWLKEFNLAEEIDIKAFGNDTYSVFIKDIMTGITNNILDVGIGTSQLLPIIIEAVNSKENSTLIIEEPEVHIHPGAQSKLGDLFVQCVNHDAKQFIIETHSIFLITQLEILVAQGKINAEDIGVYYFNHGEDGAIVKDMKLSSNGQFEEPWPSGFFDVNYNLGKTLFEFM